MKKPAENSSPAEQDFAVEEISKVTKIHIKHTDGIEVTLSKGEDGWLVNHKYKARKKALSTLLKTIKRVRVNYPVSETAHNNVMKDLISESVRVEIYLKNSKTPEKVFWVGNPSTDNLGSYLIMELDGKMASRAYICHLPGFEGFLTNRFFVEEKKWRSTEIFSYQPDEIETIEVDYPKFPEWSFSLYRDENDSFNLKLNTVTIFDNAVNTQKLAHFIRAFKSLSAEAFENEYPKKDSLIAAGTYCKISVGTLNGETNAASIFRMPLNKRSKLQFDDQGNQMKYDLDRYFAIVNDAEDFVILQHFVFGKALLRAYEFYE